MGVGWGGGSGGERTYQRPQLLTNVRAGPQVRRCDTKREGGGIKTYMFHVWPVNLPANFGDGMEHLEKTLCYAPQINNENCICVILHEKIGRLSRALSLFLSLSFFFLFETRDGITGIIEIRRRSAGSHYCH